MSKPTAVLISDIHFNINTLKLASAALKTAVDKSNKLKIVLVIAGDLNDTKAIIRAEVANSIIEILSKAEQKVIILCGNHDLVNEKGTEHGLNYLAPYAMIVDEPGYLHEEKLMLVPYHSDTTKLLKFLKEVTPGVTVIMHQGFMGAFMGDYIQDKSSIDPKELSHLTVFSGHYHRHQTINTITYIGSPYTITFGEANDGPKGFLVINNDGSFTRQILELRKHIIVERTPETALDTIEGYNPGDLLWLKVKGPLSHINTIKKSNFKYQGFKLDLIPIDSDKIEVKIDTLSNYDLMDILIDNLQDTNEHKEYLKSLWKEELNET